MMYYALNPNKQESKYGFVTESKYKRSNPITRQSIPLSSELGVLLLNTNKLENYNSEMLHPLRYVVRGETTLKEYAVIKDENTINFILDTVDDAFLFTTTADNLNHHPFAKRLSDRLQIPIYNYDPRSQIVNSINRCNSHLSLGMPSPGAANNCDGQALPIPTVSQNADNINNDNNAGADTNDNNVVETTTRNGNDDDDDIQVIENQPNSNNGEAENNQNAASTSETRPLQITGKRKQQDDSSCPLPKTQKVPWFNRRDAWEKHRTNVIQHKLLTEAQATQADVYGNWLEVLHPELSHKIALRCRICYKYRVLRNLCVKEEKGDNKVKGMNKHKGHDPGQRCNDLTALANEEGMRHEQNFKVLDKIKNHADTPTHLEATKYFNKQYEDVLEGELMETKSNKDPTCSVLRAVYQEVQMNVAFNRHPDVIELLEINGANVGTLHFSKDSAREMAMVMSSVLHSQLKDASEFKSSNSAFDKLLSLLKIAQSVFA
uniref:Uncharacterized protein n=1 Tax=Panagrolaimus davidi TaxID=227884 RepID=A0A914PVB5_9BILA